MHGTARVLQIAAVRRLGVRGAGIESIELAARRDRFRTAELLLNQE